MFLFNTHNGYIFGPQAALYHTNKRKGKDTPKTYYSAIQRNSKSVL